MADGPSAIAWPGSRQPICMAGVQKHTFGRAKQDRRRGLALIGPRRGHPRIQAPADDWPCLSPPASSSAGPLSFRHEAQSEADLSCEPDQRLASEEGRPRNGIATNGGVSARRVHAGWAAAHLAERSEVPTKRPRAGSPTRGKRPRAFGRGSSFRARIGGTRLCVLANSINSQVAGLFPSPLLRAHHRSASVSG
jgi:hypothetical protein